MEWYKKSKRGIIVMNQDIERQINELDCEEGL